MTGLNGMDPRAIFQEMTEEERRTLVALPYRVGMAVSKADSAGGDEADDIERTVLETIILSFGQDTLKAEFIQYVMEQTIRARAQWGGWQTRLEQVPQECRIVMAALGPLLTYNDVRSFQTNLLEIAYDVACAYTENRPRRSGWLFFGGKKPADPRDAAISPREAFVIEQIRQAFERPGR